MAAVRWEGPLPVPDWFIPLESWGQTGPPPGRVPRRDALTPASAHPAPQAEATHLGHPTPPTHPANSTHSAGPSGNASPPSQSGPRAEPRRHSKRVRARKKSGYPEHYLLMYKSAAGVMKAVLETDIDGEVTHRRVQGPELMAFLRSPLMVGRISW